MPPFRFAPEHAPAFAFFALLILTGCGTSTGIVGERIPARPAETISTPADAAVEAQILSAADDWMGVPYRFGGTTRDGVDCSAFVRAVYASAYGVRLTRSTRTQVKEGVPVSREALRAGDLVFFRTGHDLRHVGIYLGRGRMLHASSSKDRVLVDDFNQDYFQRTYWTARRLIDLPEPEAPAFAGIVNDVPHEPELEPVAIPTPVRRTAMRAGW